MNKVILMGRLTADPELRQTQNGIASCRIRIAVNRQFVDKNTGQREADFINCTAWRQTAEFISKYFRKGSMIMVEGTLRTGSYVDKKYQDVTHYTTEVYVDNVEFCGSKTESGNNGGNYGAPQNNYNNNYNNGYNNGYNNNGYNNGYGNNGYNQAPPPPPPPAPAAPVNEGMSYGSDTEFEEILSDGDVPF